MNVLERRKLIEYIRSYLRKNDFAVGYIPQMIYNEQASEWWSLYWFCVRRLDDTFDNGISVSGLGFNGFLDYLMENDQLFSKALSLFLIETKEIVPKELLEEIYSSMAFEKEHYAKKIPQTFATYLTLINKRSVLPFYINGLINGITKDSPYLMRLCISFSRAIQLLDDLLDLNIDLDKGRVYLAVEEFDLLKLKTEDIRNNFDKIAKLRNKLFMEVSMSAYILNIPFWNTNFGLHVRSVIEGAWKMIEDERAVPLPKAVFCHDLYYSHYVGTTSLPYDVLKISEDLKYQLFHESAVTFLKNYKVADFSTAKKILARMSNIDTGALSISLKTDISDLPLHEFERTMALDQRNFYSLEDGYGLPIAAQMVWNDSFTRLKDEFRQAISTNEIKPFVSALAKNFLGFQRSLNQEILVKAKNSIELIIPEQSDELKTNSEVIFSVIEVANEHFTKFFEEITDSLFSK